MAHTQHKKGQSIVEMALMLPILLIVIFGIIEFGWLIFAYSTISQAARNGAEVAAQLPPHESWLNQNPAGFNQDPNVWAPRSIRSDNCVNGIYVAIESQLTLLGMGVNEQDAVAQAQYVTIRYPNGGATRNLAVRGPIEISITYPVNSLTPLFGLLGMNDGVTMRVTQRRSLENLGRDPTRQIGVACAANQTEWVRINPDPTP
ncbi:TadE/TadG family type IV pilus assembly protein [Candidatus Chloroploca asiatica]|uniref:TadE-like domain-containing protein n=1 Tax=Candidatus Chloroploca asiatica TaxID=1506545 RepID=A0A2H3KFH0_9CHLR|nr:TadE family protein [Candidatus Chloroploca asiatica]PDV96419.1 hypothetical protein A9Q02_06905 [Candidatus Chloroploca asiatica]